MCDLSDFLDFLSEGRLILVLEVKEKPEAVDPQMNEIAERHEQKAPKPCQGPGLSNFAGCLARRRE